MSVLYVMEQGAQIHRRGDRLLVNRGGVTLEAISTLHLEQVVAFGNVGLTPGARTFLLEQGIDTVFLSTAGRFRGRLVSFEGRNIELRRQQFTRLGQEEFALDLAARFVRGKLHNSRTLLRRHQRSLQSPTVAASLHRIRALVERLPEARTLDEVRGLEGAAAASYFGCLAQAIRQPGFPFPARTRRPPRDAFNALLSFGYTMLLGTVTTAAQTVGLDPFLGSLHAPANRKPSLVLDLMEEFRPLLVDALALAAVNRRQMVPDDFDHRGELDVPLDRDEDEEIHRDEYPVLLKRASLKKWVALYEAGLRRTVTYPRFGTNLSYRQVCLEQARLLARHLQGEQPYEAFLVR